MTRIGHFLILALPGHGWVILFMTRIRHYMILFLYFKNTYALPVCDWDRVSYPSQDKTLYDFELFLDFKNTSRYPCGTHKTLCGTNKMSHAAHKMSHGDH